MSIEGKRAYRFDYLKSEKWKTVRSEALAKAKAKCAICGYESVFNDCHHLFYPPSFWDTKADDLVVLCRNCHQLIEFLARKGKRRGQRHTWFAAVSEALKIWITNNESPKKLPSLQQLIVGRLNRQGCFVCRTLRSQSALIISQTVINVKCKKSQVWPMCSECHDEMMKHVGATPENPATWKELRAFLDNYRNTFSKIIC